MDAIIMQQITSLLANLRSDFPEYTFTASHEFYWDSVEKIIYFDATSDDTASLLHEVAHAQLGHRGYVKDIQLIEMERDAWQYARKHLGKKYSVSIIEDHVQDALDTYRNWLHARSRCPECDATGIQVKKRTYACLACGSKWKVNDARICALRRYTLPQ